jgi:hypothetical protein
MPSDPGWALPAVDEEVRKCLEALLDWNAPRLRVLINLAVAKLVPHVRLGEVEREGLTRDSTRTLNSVAPRLCVEARQSQR